MSGIGAGIVPGLMTGGGTLDSAFRGVMASGNGSDAGDGASSAARWTLLPGAGVTESDKARPENMSDMCASLVAAGAFSTGSGVMSSPLNSSELEFWTPLRLSSGQETCKEMQFKKSVT